MPHMMPMMWNIYFYFFLNHFIFYYKNNLLFYIPLLSNNKLFFSMKNKSNWIWKW